MQPTYFVSANSSREYGMKATCALLLLASFIAVTLSTTAQRDTIFSCLETLVDVNPTDGELSEAELDEFIANRTDCVPAAGPIVSSINGAAFIALCDIDMDGVLSADDWNNATSCVQSPSRIRFMLELCERCGA